MDFATGARLSRAAAWISARVAAPSVPLATLAEAKAWLRVDFADDDDLIEALVAAATDHVDGGSGVLGRALITQSWSLTLSSFPETDRLYLPVPRVHSVTSITYRDSADVEQVLAADQYRLVAEDDEAVIELVSGGSWGQTGDRTDAVTVTYVTGYGDAASDVPQAIRTAVLLLVGHWYETRRAVTDKGYSDLPMGVKALLANYRVARGWL